MRWWASVFLLGVWGWAQAAEVFLIPENNPKPTYPKALHRAGIIGEVRARFMVSADGSVSKISILQSDHPDLAEAVRIAIEQWRFKPWTVEGGKPAEQEVVVPMMFRLDLDLPIHANTWLKTLKCREVYGNASRYMESAWVDSDVFHYTRAYLSNVFHTRQLPNEQRLALIAKLNKRVPGIVRRCAGSPSLRYTSLLPQEIQKLL